MSEDTVLESICLSGSGRPSGRWFCYTFGKRAAIHVTFCDSQRTGCSPWSVTWRARAERRQEVHPPPLSTKDRFGSGSPHRTEFSGGIPQDLRNRQPPETKLACKNVLLNGSAQVISFPSSVRGSCHHRTIGVHKVQAKSAMPSNLSQCALDGVDFSMCPLNSQRSSCFFPTSAGTEGADHHTSLKPSPCLLFAVVVVVVLGTLTQRQKTTGPATETEFRSRQFAE